jgi:hypothetical protein
MLSIFITLLGCSNPRNEKLGTIPVSLRPEVVLVDYSVIIGGNKGGAESENTGEIWRIEGQSQERVVQFRKSSLLSVARESDRVWAVQQVDDLSILHQSLDDGKNWSRVGELPMTPSEVYLDGGCGWFHGPGKIIRSCDGVKWSKISPPGKITGHSEPMVFWNGKIILGGDSLRYSTDSGDSWVSIDEKATAIHSNWAASLKEGSLRIGKILFKSRVVEWKYWLAEEFLPTHLYANGDKIIVIADDLAAPRQPAVALISNDGGATFTKKRLNGCYRTDNVSINRYGLVYVNRRGKLIKKKL